MPQKLYIYNVDGLGEKEDNLGFQLKDYDKFFVENALIKITSGDKTYNHFIIEKDTNSVRFYTDENLIPITGEEYNLEIKFGNNIITGKTIVPEDFQIILPKKNEIFSYSDSLIGFNINFNWESKRSIQGYILNVNYPFIFKELNYYGYAPYSEITFDTRYYFFGQYLPTDTVKIKILGFDLNYYEHIFKGKESSGVNGAYGYFGSSVVKKIKVLVR